MSLARELDVARRLAVDGGGLLRGYFGKPIPVECKAGDEPVTRADKESSALIVAGLHAAFPDDFVLSEEAPDDAPARLRAGRVWMVDPMDGTKDFINGFDGFSVMIGLAVGGQPVLGVVYQPIGEVMYWAAPGVAATIERPGRARATLHTASVTDTSVMRLVSSNTHRSEIVAEVRAALGTHDELNVGSVGLKLGLIARGDRDLYVNPTSHCKLWDTCAPQAILHAAGGRLSDLQGLPLHHDQAELALDHGLLASNGAVHEIALARIQHLFPRRSR